MNECFNVSGVDPNEGASVVFVMCRSGFTDGYVQLGNGHIVGANGAYVPPGARAGQYSVTLRLPYGCLPNTIIVKDDKNDQSCLDNVTVTPCKI
jgi:hypothetical protein